jgi:hypothetical protein
VPSRDARAAVLDAAGGEQAGSGTATKMP